jgi:hypothetical protein
VLLDLVEREAGTEGDRCGFGQGRRRRVHALDPTSAAALAPVPKARTARDQGPIVPTSRRHGARPRRDIHPLERNMW